jgi:hypothetical protein
MDPKAKYRCAFGPHIREALTTLQGNILYIEKTYAGKLSYTKSLTFTHTMWGLTK